MVERTHVFFNFVSENYDYTAIEIEIEVFGNESKDCFLASLKVKDCFHNSILKDSFYDNNFTVILRKLNKVLKNELDSEDLDIWYKQGENFTGLEFYFPLKNDEFFFDYHIYKGDVRHYCNK